MRVDGRMCGKREVGVPNQVRPVFLPPWPVETRGARSLVAARAVVALVDHGHLVYGCGRGGNGNRLRAVMYAWVFWSAQQPHVEGWRIEALPSWLACPASSRGGGGETWPNFKRTASVAPAACCFGGFMYCNVTNRQRVTRKTGSSTFTRLFAYVTCTASWLLSGGVKRIWCLQLVAHESSRCCSGLAFG